MIQAPRPCNTNTRSLGEHLTAHYACVLRSALVAVFETLCRGYAAGLQRRGETLTRSPWKRRRATGGPIL